MKNPIEMRSVYFPATGDRKSFKVLQPLVLLFFYVSVFGSEVLAQTNTSALADSLYATGNYAKAINAYAKDGSQTSSLQIARTYNAIGHDEKAITEYRNLIKRYPEAQIAAFELGKLLLKAKDYNGARKLFSQLTGTEENNPEYFYYLGEAFRELAQPASSLTAYKKAVEIDSTHLRALFRLGKYFVVQRETNQALKYVDAGLRFYKNDVSFINLKALIYYNDSQYGEAIPWFERILEMGETKPYVYEKLAYSHYKNWDFEEAKKNYRTLIATNDTNSAAYFGMSEALRKNKQRDSAEIYIKKGMDVQRPILADGYSRLARLARERKDLKSALEYYKLAHMETPGDDRIYFNVCTVADQYHKDPKTKLDYYESFVKKFGDDRRYVSKIVTKRIRELKEEIHFDAE